MKSQTAALVILALVGAGFAMKLAQTLFAPILLALMVGILLAPMTSRAIHRGLPAPVAAAFGLALTLAVAVLFILFLEPHISAAIAKAPMLLYELKSSAEAMQDLIAGVESVKDEVAAAIDPDAAAKPAEEKNSEAADAAAAALPDISTALAWVPSMGGQILIFVGTLFFFLLSRDEIYDLACRAFRLDSPERFIAAEQRVSRYLFAITVINAGFGLLVMMVMYLLDMPAPILWGVLAFAVNFILYLGPIMLGLTLFLAGLISFDGVQAILPAACYFALNMTEGQFVTPALVGKRMAINPFLLFMALAGLLWLWGPVGGIVALPLLVWGLTLAGLRASNAAEAADDDALTTPEEAAAPS